MASSIVVSRQSAGKAAAVGVIATLIVIWMSSMPGALADPPSSSRRPRSADGQRSRAENSSTAGVQIHCREQSPQPELIRGNYVSAGGTPERERQRDLVRQRA